MPGTAMYIRDISIACSHFPQVVIQMSFSQRGLPCPPSSKITTNPFLADAVLLCQYPLRFLCHFCVHSLLVRVHSQQPTPVSLFRRAAFKLLEPALLEVGEYNLTPLPLQIYSLPKG